MRARDTAASKSSNSFKRSPKFLAGESYGTTRAAGLSGYLQQRYGMYLNGIMLISSILNFQTAEFDVGNDLPYMLFLPTYTAIAWYHKKLPNDLQGDLQKAIAESKAFAIGEYQDALTAGDTLPSAKRTEIAQKLSRLTGLSTDYIDRANLRIEIQRFDKELMKSERRTVGRLDGRFTGIDSDAAGEQPDPPRGRRQPATLRGSFSFSSSSMPPSSSGST